MFTRKILWSRIKMISDKLIPRNNSTVTIPIISYSKFSVLFPASYTHETFFSYIPSLN